MKYLAILTIALLIGFFCLKKSQRDHIIEYISRDKMPIWLTVLLSVSAALGTYVLAPVLNQDFEFQKNRSTHVLQTVNELNKLSVELSVSVRRFNESLFYSDGNKQSKDEYKKQLGDILDKITELQWKLIDVDLVIKRIYRDDKMVHNLQNELDDLRKAIVEAKKPTDQELIINQALLVANANRECIKKLYQAANLSN